MQIDETKIPECFLIKPAKFSDIRGSFVKTLHEEIFAARGLMTTFAEEYYSYSKKGVLRGLHFQLPPHDHIKMVYCVYGRIMDAIVDLRKGSPTFGGHALFELSDENAQALYLGRGVAHGFYVLSNEAIVMYKVSTIYAPEHDAGILWNSAGVPWSDTMPIMSERDKGFPPLDQFESPFVYRNRNNDE